jgi:DNA-binding GntR family transcriptional regulator
MTSPLERLPRLKRETPVSLSGRLFVELHRRILALELKPGQTVSEQLICDEFGVSRAPVRDALRRLSDRRLVDILPQRGTIVAPIRIQDLERAQFLREAVEVALAKRAIASPKREVLCATLRNEVRMQSVLKEVGERDRFYASDERFHRMIAEFVNLGHVLTEIDRVKVQMDRFRMLIIGGFEDIPTIIDQHSGIVDAFEAGDAADMEQKLLAHLRRVFDLLPNVMRLYPEHFEAGATLSRETS